MVTKRVSKLDSIDSFFSNIIVLLFLGRNFEGSAGDGIPVLAGLVSWVNKASSYLGCGISVRT